MISKVYLVGAGPGNPGLITVKGLEILRQAEVVIYDYLVDKRILEYAKEGAELISCDKLGKKVTKLMVKKAKEGKKVARLKNGDPSIFGRLSQELEMLVKNRIEFEVVPGVTAASAAASFSGIPLTDRRFSSSVVFVTGHEDINKKESNIDWENIAHCGTIVLYMAVENISQIAEALIAGGKSKDTPVMVVANAGTINQKILKARLKNIAIMLKKERIYPPAIFIIGQVVALEKEFNWLKRNKRILFTGLSRERFFTKGTYFHLPLIKIEPMGDYREFDGYLKDITEFDWIVFTSRYGVEHFFKRLKDVGYDSRILSNIKIAVIGNSTRSRLEDFGILADLVSKKESSRGLLEEFKKINLKGKKMFLPRSDISDKGIALGLKKLKARVISSFAYRNVKPGVLPDLDLNLFDEIMFTSPSGVRNFIKRYGHPPRKIKKSYLGEVARREAKRCHL